MALSGTSTGPSSSQPGAIIFSLAFSKSPARSLFHMHVHVDIAIIALVWRVFLFCSSFTWVSCVLADMSCAVAEVDAVVGLVFDVSSLLFCTTGAVTGSGYIAPRPQSSPAIVGVAVDPR